MPTGKSVTGGLIPTGCGWSNAFAGKAYYLFADYADNWMHALEVAPDHKGVVSPASVDFAQVSGGPSSIREGLDGALYVVFYGSGTVSRFTPKDLTGSDCGSAGSAGSSGTTAGAHSSGCGCRTTRDRSAEALAAALGLGALALGYAKRRRARKAEPPS